ncbi:MAG TPA: hypothetical protein EYP98_05485, partial [Planctomycetes bacterium]|nr:hypothetical protein [Planctomycetota bacterium]
MPRDIALETTLPKTGPAQKRLQTGLGALQTGDHHEARKHMFAALEFHPCSPDLLLELMLACGDDPDAFAQWCERYVRASSDERGRLKIEGATRKRLKAIQLSANLLKPDQALTVKRVAAINELARFITRQKATGKETATRALVVRWASGLLLKIASGAPNALTKVASSVDKHQAAFEPNYEIVYKALAKVMNQPRPNDAQSSNAPTTGVSSHTKVINDQRIRAARILVGLAKQIAFKDLMGPRPSGPGSYANAARRLLGDERKRDVEAGKIWTIEELEAMSPEDRETFTEEHSDWHHPGIA